MAEGYKYDTTVRLRLDASAMATVAAFCKDEDVSLSEALSFIVNDWATMKLAALNDVVRRQDTDPCVD